MWSWVSVILSGNVLIRLMRCYHDAGWSLMLLIVFDYPSCSSPADGEDSTVSIQIKLENEGSDEELETDMLYSPQLALKLALTEWLGDFIEPHQYNSESSRSIITYLYADVFLAVILGVHSKCCHWWPEVMLLWLKNRTQWSLTLSVRPTGVSEWCPEHCHRRVFHGCSVALLFCNRHSCVPAAHHVCSHAAALPGSTLTHLGQTTSGGRGGEAHCYYETKKYDLNENLRFLLEIERCFGVICTVKNCWTSFFLIRFLASYVVCRTLQKMFFLEHVCIRDKNICI